MGVGKLTVAEELAKQTGFKVFHNSLVVGLVRSLFDWGTDVYFKIRTKFMMEMFAAGAENKVNFITTYCYAHPDDLKDMRKIKKIIEKHIGKVCYVQLSCSQKALEARVKRASRKKYSKITSVKRIRELQQEYDLETQIPGVKTLKIDNTKISHEKVVKKIMQHYKLKKIRTS